MIQHEQPHAVVWAVDDRRENLVRTGLLPTYKSHRPKKEEMVVAQAKLIHQALTALEVSMEKVDQWEADDVLASYAAQFSESFDEVIIASDDKDMDQLFVVPNLRVSHRDGRRWTLEDAKQRWGVTEAKEIRQVQALSGDAADRIPGAHRVGMKTASELIQKYKTAKAAKAAAHEQKPGLKKSLEAFDADLNLKLVTLNKTLPIAQEISLWETPTNMQINQTLRSFGLFAAL